MDTPVTALSHGDTSPPLPLDRRILLGAAGLAGIAALASKSSAGPLNPPTGPVISTLGPEPRTAVNATNTPGNATTQFTISQPGSYYLTANVSAPSGRNAIRITASNVTLDLCGFTLTGAGGASAGIALTSTAQRVNIANGTVIGFGLDGVDAGFNLHGRYERLVATSNGAAATGRLGIRVGGFCTVVDCDSSGNTGGGFGCNDSCTVTRCAAHDNTGNGISTGDRCVVAQCTASNAGNEGIVTGSSCVISECSANGCNANGISTATGCTVTACAASANHISGITASTGASITSCSACLNTYSGISAGWHSSVENCATGTNGVFGIFTSGGCAITGSSAYENQSVGIAAQRGSSVANCSAYGNSADGITVLDGSTAANCAASTNGNDGLYASGGSLVRACTARSNTINGIYCTDQCTIQGNLCAGNGNGGDGAGIRLGGVDNRVEENNCVQADRGIDTPWNGNIFLRNTCSGNTIDWVIAANNVIGPIIDRRTPASASVSGFNAASTLASTDPNANFSY